jgi:hypothetical protein
MYRFEYENESIKSKLCHLDQWLDEEAKEELQGYLKRLKETGEITGANVEVGIRPGITGFVYEISGQRLNLVYSISPSSKVIKFFDEVKLIELKLVQRSRQDRSYIYKVTDAGQRLATSTNWDTQQRLFAEAMIGYYPIQVILEEITRGEKELEVELIQQGFRLTHLS